jgi:hypothetical protein
MAKRPDFSKAMLTREDLEALQRRLSQMSTTAVQDFYRTAHFACRFQEDRLPSARSIQELVQVWKNMRKWYR